MSFFPSLPYCIHLRIPNLVEFRKGFLQPYDYVLMRAMIETMNDLVYAFYAHLGYCNQFEMFLLFNQTTYLAKTLIEMLTMVTSFATNRFNYYLVEYFYSHTPNIVTYSPSKIDSILAKQALFTSEYYQSPTFISDMPSMYQFIMDKVEPYIHQMKAEYASIPLKVPDFVTMGVMAHYKYGQTVNYEVPNEKHTLQPGEEILFHFTQCLSGHLYRELSDTMLLQVPLIKTTSTEVDTARVVPPPLDIQNSIV